jgi:hypothetical protein
MATTSKIPWDKLKADTLRAICRDFGANPGKRKREGMLEFLRAVETTGRASRPRLAHPHRSSLLTPPFATSISPPIIGTHIVDEALKLNIEDKEETSPRRPTTKRARHAEEHPAGASASAAAPAESSPEGGAGRPKRKAAPAPATEAPVRSRGKKVKTDAAAPAAGAPASKAKKGAEKKVVSSGDDEAAKDQQEADEVDALADDPAENGAAAPNQGAFLPFSPLFCANS